MTKPRLIALTATVAAVLLVGLRFVIGAHETLTRTRQDACRALAPDPLPAAVKDGVPPDFTLPDVTGKKISLRDLRGHPVLINFWATWCPPCVEEAPSIEDLARHLEGTDVRMLAVSVDDSWDAVRQFFAKGTSLPVLLDPDKEVAKRYGTEKFPETFLIDAQGRIRHYFINKRDWSRPEVYACLETLK